MRIRIHSRAANYTAKPVFRIRSVQTYIGTGTRTSIHIRIGIPIRQNNFILVRNRTGTVRMHRKMISPGKYQYRLFYYHIENNFWRKLHLHTFHVFELEENKTTSHLCFPLGESFWPSRVVYLSFSC